MSEEVRAFVAVLLGQDLQHKIALVQEEFIKISPEVKWVSEENFHVTLKFLGNVEEHLLGDISEALIEALGDVEPFDIEIGSVGAFPSKGRPKTVWVDVTSGGSELKNLAERVDKALETVGFPCEDRPFRSHITIGRVKDDRGARKLSNALRDAQIGMIGTIRVDAVALMKSELRRVGPIYTMLSETPLR